VKFAAQGVEGEGRHLVVVRSLVFVRHGGDMLFLRGAPDKRLWAGKLNGIGGQVERGEDILEGALRELREETGLVSAELSLRGLIHVLGPACSPGVLVCAFLGWVSSRQVVPSREGELLWFPLDDLPWDEMVDDLPSLLPRLLAAEDAGRLVYGQYEPDAAGEMVFRFRAG